MGTRGEYLTHLREKRKGWKKRPPLVAALKAIGVNVSSEAIRQYETDAAKPGPKVRAGLAKVYGVTEESIEFAGGEPQRQTQKADSPEVDRLIRAFSWLMDEEREDLLNTLEAKATTNKAIAKQLGPRFRVKPDQEMLEHLQRSGALDAEGKVRSKRGTPRPKEGRDAGTAMDDFLGEDE